VMRRYVGTYRAPWDARTVELLARTGRVLMLVGATMLATLALVALWIYGANSKPDACGVSASNSHSGTLVMPRPRS
jgi:hypothetical protein